MEYGCVTQEGQLHKQKEATHRLHAVLLSQQQRLVFLQQGTWLGPGCQGVHLRKGEWQRGCLDVLLTTAKHVRCHDSGQAGLLGHDRVCCRRANVLRRQLPALPPSNKPHPKASLSIAL